MGRAHAAWGRGMRNIAWRGAPCCACWRAALRSGWRNSRSRRRLGAAPRQGQTAAAAPICRWWSSIRAMAGSTPARSASSGVYEKYITFPTAIDLARVLRATRRFRVALTRGADEYVSLRRAGRPRSRVARRSVFVDPRRCAAQCGDARAFGVHLVDDGLGSRGRRPRRQ